MSQQNYGGQAFPFVITHADGMIEYDAGMTLRDWFAGLAMQALIQTATNDSPRTLTRYGSGARIDRSDYADTAYQYADAMLAEREK